MIHLVFVERVGGIYISQFIISTVIGAGFITDHIIGNTVPGLVSSFVTRKHVGP
jgi:hypothetical protein